MTQPIPRRVQPNAEQSNINQANVLDIERTLHQVVAPRREDFRKELRTRVITAAAEQSPTMKTSPWKWLLTTPLIAGAALAVIFSVSKLDMQNSGSILTAQEVLAASIDNLFAEVQKDEVRYQRIRQVDTYGEHSSTRITQHWVSGLNSRTDTQLVNDELNPPYSFMTATDEAGERAVCWYAKDGIMADGPEGSVNLGEINCGPSTPAVFQNIFQHDTSFSTVDVEPQVITENGFQFWSWETSQPIDDSTDVFTYIEGPLISGQERYWDLTDTLSGYDWSSAEAIVDYNIPYRNRPVDGGYRHRVPLVEAGLSDEQTVDLARIYWQIMSEDSLSPVYLYTVASDEVTTVTDAQLAALQQSAKVDAVNSELESNDEMNVMTAMQELLTQARDHGQLLSELRTEVDGKAALKLTYRITDDAEAGGSSSEITFLILTDTQELIQVEHGDERSSVLLNIEENTILENVTSTEFFTEAYWKQSLPAPVAQ